MKKKIIIPSEIENILPDVGNKTKQKSLLKIYNALVLKSKYANKEGWFEVSSKYLRKINGRYSSIISILEENNIIEHLEKVYEAGSKYGDLFEAVTKKSYSNKLGVCIRYRFLINIEEGNEHEIEFEDPKLDKKWYKTLKSSLEFLGYTNPKISRDRFGARVYHELIPVYKKELKGKGFCTIDAKTSQPRLLYLTMKERGVIDEKYFDIFESDRDFYVELQLLFDLEDRKEAKDIFMFWALGNGYTKECNLWKEFPVATKFLKDLKARNYKDSSRYLSWKESRIFIDDLLENLPVNFGIPVHDSFIVHSSDAKTVLEYCQNKYPELRFKLEII